MFNPWRIFLNSSSCRILGRIIYLIWSWFRFSRSWLCNWLSWCWRCSWSRSSWSYLLIILSLLSLLLFIILDFLFLLCCPFNDILNSLGLTYDFLWYWNLRLWLGRSLIWFFDLLSSWHAFNSWLSRHNWSLVWSNHFWFSRCDLSLRWNVFFSIWNLWIDTMSYIFFVLSLYFLLCFSPFFDRFV